MANRKEVFRASVNSIPEGCSIGDEVIVFRDGERILVGPNRCRHQGGAFRFEDNCFVCPRHNWRLEPKSMRYLSPAGLVHPTFDTRKEGGEIVATNYVEERPWEDVDCSPSQLQADELTVRFLAHACVEIQCGEQKIVTDPWLVGPAFSRGWWLQHNPPTTWRDDMKMADAIFISHNHSDHLNPHTLKELAKENVEIPIFVPEFESGSCERLVRRAGLRNITSVPFGTWVSLGAETRFMVLRDFSGREDSGLLIDYRGHLILNTVDCSNLNNGVLPSKVSVLLTSFAGGASGFPICWSELYSVAEIERRVEKSLALELAKVREIVRAVDPDFYIPFAGYFTEAHPADFEVRSLNKKNLPQKAILSAELNDGTRGWLPVPGGVLDIATGVTRGGISKPRSSWEDEFSQYLAPFEESLHASQVAGLEGIQHYFHWVGFRGDLVLHVIETDESFKLCIREFFVDFRNGAVVPTRPSGEFRYLRMRVRASVFRHVLLEGQPWEELSIGFQARFYRAPDRYNFDFWDHMQNHLPGKLPWD